MPPLVQEIQPLRYVKPQEVIQDLIVGRVTVDGLVDKCSRFFLYSPSEQSHEIQELLFRVALLHSGTQSVFSSYL